MNRQEIFDKVSSGLLAQGAVCTRIIASKGAKALRLAYRGEGGCRCAAGFLIPDILYRPEMEGHLFDDEIFKAVRRTMGISHEDTVFITFLQRVHDNWPPSSWREELAALGLRFNLDISAIWPLSNPNPTSLEDRKD